MINRPLQILIIEDEAQIRRFLRTPLDSHGYGLLEASTGQEGIEQAAQLTPDGVILDLGLPDMDGLEVLQRIRSWSAVPVVILTAHGQWCGGRFSSMGRRSTCRFN
jgi:two-component system KDP operon response regulator KdpE